MNRVALVTGASRGIGRRAAVRLAEAGFDVALASRTMKPGQSRDVHRDGTPFQGSLEETAALVEETGARALVVPIDLQDRASAEAAVATTVREWKRLDALVNNALYTNPSANSRVLDTNPDEVGLLLEANVVTQLVLAQRAISHMLERGEGGAIINIISGVWRLDPQAATGEGGWAFGYAALKGAFARLTPMIHVEHAADGIRAFSLEPGGVPTENFQSAFPPDVLPLLLDDPAMNLVSEDVPAALITWLAERPERSERYAGKVLDCETVVREESLLSDDEIRVSSMP